MTVANTLALAPFDAADYLTTPDRIAEYLNAALAENDPAFLEEALAVVAKSPAFRAAKSKALTLEAPTAIKDTGKETVGGTLIKVAAAVGLRLQLVLS